jgi:hypothetical protein
MAGEAEPRPIEHGLADRVGNDRAGIAGKNEAHRALDGLLDGASVGRIRTTLDDRACNGERQHRQRLAKPAGSFARVSDSLDSYREAQPIGPSGEHIGVAQEDKRWYALGHARSPSEERDVRANPGGIAKRQCERPLCHRNGIAPSADGL